MAVVLAGGCRVSEMNEGSAQIGGSLKIWSQISRDTGANAISMRVMEFGQGQSPLLKNDESDEVLYVLENFDGSQAWSDCALVDRVPPGLAVLISCPLAGTPRQEPR